MSQESRDTERRHVGEIFLSKELAHHQYEQALAALEVSASSVTEKVEMLMEIAMGLQMRPKSPEQILDAVSLYERALELCPAEDILLSARLHARMATALQMVPAEHSGYMMKAREELETALVILSEHGLPEEVAEAQLNLGLVIQSLVSVHKGRIAEAIELYQKALRIFTRTEYPTEYAILHNNLATAFLSIPTSDERSKMREALAVQSFEAALQVVTIEDNPSEFAMLQNNLGNALQYVSSSHAIENNARALLAYDEALKVRTRRTMPLPYATTISNKANCLRNLPDDPDAIRDGATPNLLESKNLYEEAREIFSEYQEDGKIQMITGVLVEISKELEAIADSHVKSSKDRQPDMFGTSRVQE